MSAPKKRPPPSNLQLVSDKEVAISLERLIDSVVMETTAHRSALQSQQVNESNDHALGINSLPDEVIKEVFGYLTQNQLGQIARVCRRWNVLIKSPVFWRKVNVKIFSSYKFEIIKSFIIGLPSCVTSISLDFAGYAPLYFEELCLRLQEKCPHLEELILIHSVLLKNSLSSVIDLCIRLLQDVKNLIFHSSVFRYDSLCSTDEYFGISKIKILGLFRCNVSLNSSNKFPFSKIPNLKQLHLYGTNIDYSWFKNGDYFLNQLEVLNLGFTKNNSMIFSTIQDHGHNLNELYLCYNNLEDNDLNFNDSVFPQLKTICIYNTNVKCEGVVSLVQLCPSLENVYVNEDVAESFAAHPFVVANRCKSGIVKVSDMDPIHKHGVDYSHT